MQLVSPMQAGATMSRTSRWQVGSIENVPQFPKGLPHEANLMPLILPMSQPMVAVLPLRPTPHFRDMSPDRHLPESTSNIRYDVSDEQLQSAPATPPGNATVVQRPTWTLLSGSSVASHGPIPLLSLQLA